MYFILIIVLVFTTTVFAQDIPQDTVNKRIQQLETEKTQLENIYKEIIVRIDELKQLLKPEQPIQEQPADAK